LIPATEAAIDRHFDMPLVNPPLLQPNSEIMTIIFNQSQERPATFLAETPLTDTIANFFPK
jgi:hypothetical protein